MRFADPLTLVDAVVACLLCGTSVAHAQNDVRLSGVVLDATTSRPLIGAIVAIAAGTDARSTRTDETGSFIYAKLALGSYKLTVRRLGYEPSSQTVALSGDTRVTITLNRLTALDTVRVLAAPQAIFGVVATAHELRPLPDATVEVYGTSVGRASVDSAGHFFYAIKSPGAYLVRGKAAGLGSQAVSVIVREHDGVEVALLLDSIPAVGANALESAYADFRERLVRRGIASAVVSRSELQGNGDRDLVSSLLTAHSFGSKGLRFTDVACVFVDGAPRVGVSPNAFDPKDIEAVEAYSASADRSGTLASRWPRGMPCGDTGMPRSTGSGGSFPGNRDRSSDVVRWIVIWMKQ
jgi:hypothetical protein